MNIFLQRIKELRIEKELTQKKLADILQITNKKISFWETGAIEPDLNDLINLSKFFKVSIDYILGNEEEWQNATLQKSILAIKKSPELAEDEKEILEMYNKLNEKYKALLKTTCEIYLDQEDNFSKNLKSKAKK